MIAYEALIAAAQRALIVLEGVSVIRRPGDSIYQLAVAITDARRELAAQSADLGPGPYYAGDVE